MPTYNHPGIYIEEVPGARSVQGASTSTAAFIGVSETGTNELPVLLTSWSAYQREFGGLTWGAFMPWAVYEFFSEGGTACYGIRASVGKGARGTLKLGAVELATAAPGPDSKYLMVAVTNATPSKDGKDTPVFSVKVVADVTIDTVAQNIKKSDLLSILLLSYIQRNKIAKERIADKDYYVLESFGGFTSADQSFADRVNQRSIFIRVTKAGEGRIPNAAPKPLAGGQGIENNFEAAYQTLDKVQGVSLLSIPDTVLLPATSSQAEAINKGLNFCQKMTNLFYAVDPPFGLNVTEITNFKTGSATSPPLNSSYGAIYYPWLLASNPNGGANVPIPPSGAVLGRYAGTDSKIGVWKVAAGVNDGQLRTISAVDTKVTDADQDQFNGVGVNAIRNLIGYGNVIWGARTLSMDSQWTYINVRRLFIYVEQSLLNSLQWVVFEPNDQKLWASVKRDISSFLTVLWQQGGLFGASAAEAFFVVCDQSNNPEDTRRLGRLYIDIGIAPVFPAEFVIIRIAQKTAASA